MKHICHIPECSDSLAYRLSEVLNDIAPYNETRVYREHAKTGVSSCLDSNNSSQAASIVPRYHLNVNTHFTLSFYTRPRDDRIDKHWTCLHYFVGLTERVSR